MTRAHWSRSGRGPTLFGFLVLAVAAARMVIFYQGRPQLVPAILLTAGYGLLDALTPRLSKQLGWAALASFPLQAAFVLVVTNLRPFLDASAILYLPLFLQAVHSFPRRAAFACMIVLAALLSATLVVGMGWATGLAFDLMVLGGCAFLVSYDLLSSRAQADQARSHVLLTEVQQAHLRLRDYADQAEQLAAAHERNRLARELHDSVSQVIFSITLTGQAARLLLEHDPARVPEQLDRLDEMTRSALGQLRSLIARLHSQPNSGSAPGPTPREGFPPPSD